MARVAFKTVVCRKKEEYKNGTMKFGRAVSPFKTNRYQRIFHFLDESTNSLFGVLKTEDPSQLDNLPSHAVIQKWWHYMADIMESNPDSSPVSIPLQEVFIFYP